CRERGIRVLPPDVNESREDFTVLTHADANGLRPIRFGLCAVRGVGSKAVETILAARVAEGPFKSLVDFCKRVLSTTWNGTALVSGVAPASAPGDARSASAERSATEMQAPAQVNKKVIESLIKCGAFDFTGASRRQLCEGLDKALQWGAAHAKEDTNQFGLFASKGIKVDAPEPALPAVAPWPDRDMLKTEREAPGVYLSAHPLDKAELDLPPRTPPLS